MKEKKILSTGNPTLVICGNGRISPSEITHSHVLAMELVLLRPSRSEAIPLQLVWVTCCPSNASTTKSAIGPIYKFEFGGL